MTVRCCLSFAAVQYDDLQSLVWLSESVGPPDNLVGGWNLLHYSAFMGRIEIIGWLSTQPAWQSMVSNACTRQNLAGEFAVHIAANCGHLYACDLLIGLKVPLEDENGKLPEDYAKKSQHDCVRKWAAKRLKPLALKKHVENLLYLVNEQKCVSEIKGHILSSGCLDIETWCDCGCQAFDERLVEMSFQDVITICCRHPDIELAKWICFQLCFSHSEVITDVFWEEFGGKVDTKVLCRDDLVSFARERGYDDLLSLLLKEWCKDISCTDPATQDYGVEAALSGDERCFEVKAAILRIAVLASIAKTSFEAIEDILRRGGRVDELKELVRINAEVRKVVSAEAGGIFENGKHHSSYRLRAFKMTYYTSNIFPINDTVSKLLLYEEVPRYELHTFLASEGYTDLLHFCLSNFEGWNATMELNVIRIASFFGHGSIVEMLLSPCDDFVLSSDRKDRHKSAVLGAGEALSHRDMKFLLYMPTNVITVKGRKEYFHSDLRGGNYDMLKNRMRESLVVVVLNGYVRELYDTDVDSKTSLTTLRLLVDENICAIDEIIYAMNLLLDPELLDPDWNIEWISYVSLLESIIDVMGIEPISHSVEFRGMCRRFTYRVELEEYNGYSFEEEEVDAVTRFLTNMAKTGIDFQFIMEDFDYTETVFVEIFFSLQKKQLEDWSLFDVIKKDSPLADIQQIIEHGGLTLESRDRGGLLLTHLSAAYDRADLLEWLVDSEDMDLDALDAQHRTTLDVAKASNATLTTKWITEWKAKAIIGSFLRRSYFCTMYKRRLHQSNQAASLIQSAIRAYSIRKIYSNVLTRRMEESQQFTHVWGSVIASIDNATATTWTNIREQLVDIKVGLDDEMLDDTHERLNRAVEEAITGESNEGRDDEGVSNFRVEFDELLEDDSTAQEATHHSVKNSQWLSFQMTSHVVKFLQQGDKKYRSFFVRRMRQLASGERSRILQKPLKGSKSSIYETYLEQKSGHRILWTEENDNLVIWYIAKHKQVSRLMQLIDDSKSRSARQQMPANLVSELQNEGLLSPDESKKEVLLDIFGNVPLKIYDINFNTINEIAKESWTPQLHLTNEERDIVEADGTVLVLGRSGTGKTVCICNRIECDRQSRAGCDPTFTQLFVARSVRLCRYVAGAVGEDNRTTFLTYARLLNDIESTLPGHTRNFDPSQKIDFYRFKRDFHNRSSSSKKISALTLWTVIRTFLKGSIEAFQSPNGILPKDTFLEVERLGKNRCRVPVELRGQVYDEFIQYEKYLEDEQLWDDCDRVHHILLRIKHAKEADPDAFNKVQKSKVYVDEVQDYTQLEILLFFHLSGPNGLFLAGDPAQSVVEGTEFRFEEVRSVGHFVGSVMNKPKTVNINFRSHSGILNCAGGVLDFLFSHFPSSAKQLTKDTGLFQGSRPGVLLGTSLDQLNTLLNDKLKGAVVLAHDESAPHWRRLLNDYKLVYGIREAKGLEFKTVIILDFFRDIPPSLQKPWRELVLGRATQDFQLSHPLVATFLKLLYTGVTRGIEKLFFVETKSSIAVYLE